MTGSVSLYALEFSIREVAIKDQKKTSRWYCEYNEWADRYYKRTGKWTGEYHEWKDEYYEWTNEYCEWVKKYYTESSKVFERKAFQVFHIIKKHWVFKITHESLLSEPLKVAFS